MAVQTNPYRYWEDGRDEADYRSRETQASSLTRQMLRQPEYLRDRNRVNPGPSRNLRARVADAQSQVPHETRNEDMWGWQRWTDRDYYLIESPLSNNLLEETDIGSGEYAQISQPTYTLPDPLPSVVEQTPPTSYTHTQLTPSAQWTIIHNLGFYPSVLTLNNDNAVMVGMVTHVTVNALYVTFNVPVSGTARLS